MTVFPKPGSVLVPGPFGFADAAQLVVAGKQTVVLSHAPIYAVVCTGNEDKIWDSVLQQGMTDSGLAIKSPVVISGHMHWAQLMDFGGKLPTQVVIGNSGTMLIPKYLDATAIKKLEVAVRGHARGHHGRRRQQRI